MTTPATTGAAKPTPIEWDLTHVLPAIEGPAFERLLADLEAKVSALEARREGLDASVRTPSDVVSLVQALADVSEVAHRLDAYGSLRFSTDTTDAVAKSFMQKMDQVTTDAGNRIRFISLWWKSLDDERAAALMPGDPEIRYYLERVRAFRPHTLSEAEERVIALKDTTGGTALDRLREILTSSYKYKDPKTGEMVTQSELVRHVHDQDPQVREATYHELWRVYREHESELAFLYQTVVTDWANEQLLLRKHASPIGVRNKGNDVPDEAVETLLQVCRDNAPLFHRYFTWKGRKLGLSPMSRYHVYAPLPGERIDVPYDEAKDKVLRVFDAFSPLVGREARKVFDENHVHVYPGPSKRGGAFCATVVSTMTPYVFLNHTGDASSLKTLAHEMGHAIHSLLARDRFPLVAHSTLPLAETASVFAEMLLHRTMMEEADEGTRAALLSEKIGEIYATVMRQAYFVIFEKEAHRLVREGASAEDLHQTYAAQLKEQFGPIHVPEEFKREWTYIPHIYASPFYCYAYSFGMLLSLALYGRYLEEGESFVPKYLELLSSGGSASPETLLARLGVDVRDRAFWQKGFDVIREMVDELEKIGA